MMASISLLSATPCAHSLSSWSCLAQLRRAHRSLPAGTAFLPLLRRHEASWQCTHETGKSPAATRDVRTLRVAGFEPQGRRESGTPVSIVCRASGGSTATENFTDTGAFVEIGTIAETHGLYGELRVRSLTDFPEERFETPGVRWIRRVIMGKPSIRRVELVEGREIFGKQSSWLVTLKGFDTPEKASELLGATMLVSADERPASLEDDEDYIPDLVGMAVVIQETKEEIGTIVDVHSSGTSDLLRVQLNPSNRRKDVRIWIPFVKDIVPVVDNDARRVEITPPEGLLDLNVPKEGLSRKDIRKQGRKNKAILAAIRKRLTALGQTHVLEGLSTGDEVQQRALTDQLMSIDFGLFQRALLHALGPQTSQQRVGEPEPPPAIPRANWPGFETWSNVKMHKKRPANSNNATARWWYKGLQLVANGEVAVVVLAGGQSTRLGPGGPPVKGMLELDLPEARSLFELQAERLRLVQELATQVYPEATPQIPWLILTSDATDGPTRTFFEEKEFFGLDESQVWFVKQDSLPCIDRDEGHAILLESPWKVAVAPSGNGGLFSALHAQGFLERLSEEGVQYVQVYSVDNALARVADPVFFGYTHERKADVGVKVVKKKSPEESVGVLCLKKSTPGKNITTSEDDASDGEDVAEFDDDVEEEATPAAAGAAPGPTRTSSHYYGVLEYSEMPSALRTAKEGDELVFRAAHICINLFSVDYLKKLAEAGFELGFHAALKRIPCLKKDSSGDWTTVVPDQPNGIKLEQFIFDAFKYCDAEKVALLEVDRAEEFAPIKNGAGPGASDTAETARDMVLALRGRLASSTPQSDESAVPGEDEKEQTLSLLRAYVCGA